MKYIDRRTSARQAIGILLGTILFFTTGCKKHDDHSLNQDDQSLHNDEEENPVTTSPDKIVNQEATNASQLSQANVEENQLLFDVVMTKHKRPHFMKRLLSWPYRVVFENQKMKYPFKGSNIRVAYESGDTYEIEFNKAGKKISISEDENCFFSRTREKEEKKEKTSIKLEFDNRGNLSIKNIGEGEEEGLLNPSTGNLMVKDSKGNYSTLVSQSELNKAKRAAKRHGQGRRALFLKPRRRVVETWNKIGKNRFEIKGSRFLIGKHKAEFDRYGNKRTIKRGKDFFVKNDTNFTQEKTAPQVVVVAFKIDKSGNLSIKSNRVCKLEQEELVLLKNGKRFVLSRGDLYDFTKQMRKKAKARKESVEFSVTYKISDSSNTDISIRFKQGLDPKNIRDKLGS